MTFGVRIIFLKFHFWMSANVGFQPMYDLFTLLVLECQF